MFKKLFSVLFLVLALVFGVSAQNTSEELHKKEQDLQKELADLNQIGRAHV